MPQTWRAVIPAAGYGDDVGEHGPAKVTARARAHFATIARAMAEEKREQIERAALETTAEGIRTGLELSTRSVWSRAVQELEDERADRQVELAQRGQRLRRSTRVG